jgi:hypothetical protein
MDIRRDINVKDEVYGYRCEIHPSVELEIKGEKDDNNVMQYQWKLVNLKGISLDLYVDSQEYLTILECLEAALCITNTQLYFTNTVRKTMIESIKTLINQE